MSFTIIIANPFFPPHAPGGAEYSLEQMCRRFAAAGWRVRVVTNCFDGRPRVETLDGYAVEFVESPLVLPPGQDGGAMEYVQSAGCRERMRRALVRAAAAAGPDAILVANNGQCFEAVADARAETGRPAVGIVRDTQAVCATGACLDNRPAREAVPCRGLLGAARCLIRFQRDRGQVRGWRPIPGLLVHGLLGGWQRRRLRRRGLARMDRVVAISGALRDLVGTVPGIDPRRIVTIRNFCTADPPAEAARVEAFLEANGLEDGRFFLMAGRKTYGKGADLAVAAAELLHRTHPRGRLLLVGRGRVAAPPHPAWVDHSSIPPALLLGLLARAAALVIPGRWQEGLHRGMIDALQLGIPIVCTEAGAPSVEGVIQGENGLVVPCNDAGALADAMRTVLDWKEGDRQRCRAAAARRFAERFADGVILREWSGVFEELTCRFGRQPEERRSA